MARPSASLGLVGRRPELAVLTDALAEAAAGQARAVLLTGDAGVSKTRPLGALADSAATVATVVTGHCMGLPGVPYLPFAEALATLAHRAGLLEVPAGGA